MIMGEERRRDQGTETRSEGRRRLCLSSTLLRSPSVHVSMCEICPTFPSLWNLLVIVFCFCPTRSKKTFLGLKEAETCRGGGERGLSVSGELEAFALLFPSIISAVTKDSVNFQPFGSKCSCSSPPTGPEPTQMPVCVPCLATVPGL